MLVESPCHGTCTLFSLPHLFTLFSLPLVSLIHSESPTQLDFHLCLIIAQSPVTGTHCPLYCPAQICMGTGNARQPGSCTRCRQGCLSASVEVSICLYVHAAVSLYCSALPREVCSLPVVLGSV